MLHVAKICEDMFYVFSEAADYEYIVRVEDESEASLAMDIAEKEAIRWGSPDDSRDDYDYYYNSGYVEVVENALSQANIEATYFVIK